MFRLYLTIETNNSNGSKGQRRVQRLGAEPPRTADTLRSESMEGRIVMSRQDANRLRSLVAAERARGQGREHLADLEHELDRARVVEGQLLPDDRVAVNSTVRVRDLDSGVAHSYTLVWPSQADAAKRHISVLAP